MDIWEKMYEEAQKLHNPHEVSDFVYANPCRCRSRSRRWTNIYRILYGGEPVVFSISAQSGQHSSICTNSRDKLRLKSLSLSRQTTLWWKFRYALWRLQRVPLRVER